MGHPCSEEDIKFLNNDLLYMESGLPIFHKLNDDVKLPLRFGRLVTKEMKYNKACRKIKSWRAPEFTGTLREKQEEIYAECKNILNVYDGLLLELCPGFGKTVMAIALSCEKYLPAKDLKPVQESVIVVVHRTGLITQWGNTISTFTNGTMFTTKQYIDFMKQPVRMNTKFFVISMDTELPLLFPYADKFGTLVIDEAHCFCTASRIPKVLMFNVNRVICCSATPRREDNSHFFITALCGYGSVVRKSSQWFTVYTVNTGAKIPVTKNCNTGRVDWAQIVREVSESEQRNDAIKKIAIEIEANGKILILTNTVNHSKVLAAMLRDLGQEVAELYGTKKKYNDSRILIGTVSKIGTGFDEASGCDDWKGKRLDVLIMACSFKNMELLEQVKGRVDRSDNPTIYEFSDGNGILIKQYKNRIKWYRETGTAEIKRLSV